MSERCLSIDEVAAKTSLHRATIYRLIKAGNFPVGKRLTPHRRGWNESTIDAWLAEREPAET